MKHKFEFDKKTGTMRPSSNAVEQGLKTNIQQDVIVSQTSDMPNKPKFVETKKLEIKSAQSGLQGVQVVKMKRVKTPTAIQLINENGLPESYLDSENTGVMMFRELEDYDICQIADEKSGKVLAYIGGYALQINFNMAELRTMERIEQCLQGITKLFRHQLMTQNLGPEDSQ